MDTKNRKALCGLPDYSLLSNVVVRLTQLAIAISSVCPVTGISVAAKPKGIAAAVKTAIAMADVG